MQVLHSIWTILHLTEYSNLNWWQISGLSDWSGESVGSVGPCESGDTGDINGDTSETGNSGDSVDLGGSIGSVGSWWIWNLVISSILALQFQHPSSPKLLHTSFPNICIYVYTKFVIRIQKYFCATGPGGPGGPK